MSSVGFLMMCVCLGLVGKKVKGWGLCGGFFAAAFFFDNMFELQEGEVHFVGGFRAGGVEPLAQQVRNDFTAFLQEVFLAGGLRGFRKLGKGACQFADFRESLDNRKGGVHRAVAFENGGEHVKGFFGEGLGEVFGMLAPFGNLKVTICDLKIFTTELVKIFDRFILPVELIKICDKFVFICSQNF